MHGYKKRGYMNGKIILILIKETWKHMVIGLDDLFSNYVFTIGYDNGIYSDFLVNTYDTFGVRPVITLNL